MKIEVKNLSKKFRSKEVVKNVNITFEEGNIYGIIGKNGSGKSVFLKILCAFYMPTSGEILQDGIDYIKNNTFPKSTRALIENPEFISNLTGYENLKLLAAIQDICDDNNIIKTLKDVNLFEEKDKQYKEYSLGMKQKLGIAQVLMEDPKVLILDEPFNGVDDESILLIKKELKRIKKDRIIIITSHIKEDILELSDEIYKFNNGELLKQNDIKTD